MKIQITSKLVKGRYKDQISGIYKLTFDNGFFYIGSSNHLRRRLYIWGKALSGNGKVDIRHLWKHIIPKIQECTTAIFELIEGANNSELLNKEELHMVSYRDNPLMINKILHPRNGVIVKSKDNIEICRYPSLKQAALQMKIFTRRIQDVCNGRRKTCCGYIFEWENKALRKPVFFKLRPKKEKVLKILRFNTSGEFINGYFTKKSAAMDCGVHPKGIYSVLKGKQKTAGGFIFKYA